MAFASPGIKRRAIGITRPAALRFARRDQSRDLAAAFEARIDQAHCLEPLKCRTVVAPVLGLPPHRGFPRNPEPRQVFVDRRFVFRPAAGRVDILDPQQEPSAVFTVPFRH